MWRFHPPLPAGRNLHKGSAYGKLMVVPPVTPLRMNPRMAGLAQRHEVSLVMGAALCQRHPVVYLLHRMQQPFLITLLTERMLYSVSVTDSFPRPAIPTAYSRVSVILLVAAVLLLLMLLTEPSLCQLWASREGTRPLWFPWHCFISLRAKEKPPLDFSHKGLVHLSFF